MILAEAVIPRAARAVAELQLRMVRIGAAAHGAFVAVRGALLLAADALRLALEVHGLADLPGPPEVYGAEEHIPAEEQIVERRHDRQKIEREAEREDLIDKVRRVRHGEPLDLDRDDVHEQHPLVGIVRCEREEHRKIDELRADAHRDAAEQIDEKGVQDREHHTGEEVHVELGLSPLALHRGADEVIEIEEQQPPDAAGVRDEHEGHQPPDLPAQDHLRIEREKIAHRAGAVHQRQQPDDGVADDEIAHEIFHAETRMADAVALDPTHECFQIKTPFQRKTVTEYLIIPHPDEISIRELTVLRMRLL